MTIPSRQGEVDATLRGVRIYATFSVFAFSHAPFKSKNNFFKTLFSLGTTVLLIEKAYNHSVPLVQLL